MTITRTYAIGDLSPQEVDYAFTEMDSEKQAQFFAEIGKIAATWPGAGMCMQALCIARNLDSGGRYVIERLADHAGLLDQPADCRAPALKETQL